MSTKTLSNNVKIFNGSIDSLLSCCCTEEKLSMITKSVTDEIKNTVVLYTTHIEEKYFEFSVRPTKRVRNDHMDYLLYYINHRQYVQLSPLTRMWLFSALNIPRAINCLSKSQFESFVEELYHHVDKCKKTHGDMVGIEAAQSCSERFTQSTLNAFHSAGAKKSALVGIKRIEEILDAYKKLNLPIIGPFNTKYDVKKLFARTMEDYCSHTGIIYSPELCPNDKLSNFLLYFKLNDPNDWTEIYTSSYLTKKNKKAMFFKDGVIYFSLHKNSTIEPYKLPMEKNEKSPPIPNHVYSAYTNERYRHISGLRNCVDYDEEDMLLFFKPKSSLASCIKSPFPDLPDKYRTNIDNIEILNKCPDINLNELISNDIYWIYTNLGIAAVEEYLTREIKTVLGAEGININIQHINLITANMTRSGEIGANTYHGLKNNNNVIRKATFQQGTETFSKAASCGYIDNFNDVSAQIMMGKLPSIGTNTVIINKIKERPSLPSPASPAYSPPLSPAYCPVSPSPASPPLSPAYYPASPSLTLPLSPAYCPASPIYCPASPEYNPTIDIIIEPEIHI